jgi:hypothetical protein
VNSEDLDDTELKENYSSSETVQFSLVSEICVPSEVVPQDSVYDESILETHDTEVHDMACSDETFAQYPAGMPSFRQMALFKDKNITDVTSSG